MIYARLSHPFLQNSCGWAKCSGVLTDRHARDRERKRPNVPTQKRWSFSALEVIYSYFGDVQNPQAKIVGARVSHRRAFSRMRALRPCTSLVPTGSGCSASRSKTLLKGPASSCFLERRETDRKQQAVVPIRLQRTWLKPPR